MSAVYFVARSSVYVGCIVHIVAHTFACRSLTFWRACDIVRSRLRVQKRSTSTTSQNCARRINERARMFLCRLRDPRSTVAV